MNAPFNAMSEALADVRQYQRDGVFIFKSPSDFFDFVQGPRQHNQHVECYRGHLWLERRLEAGRRFDAEMRARYGLPAKEVRS
jgi:hypothetical protein